MTSMRRYVPSVSALQAFESAARHLSFSRAAEELHLTQSAISRQVRSLENQLGVRLFRRVRQRVVLSEAGQAYATDIRACLDRIEASTAHVLNYRRGAGVLNVSILPTFGAKWLAPRLPEFIRRHPGMLINFLTQLRPFDLSASDIDAAIYFGSPIWPNVVAERLIGEELVAVCSPTLFRVPPRDPRELMQYPLLHLTTIPNAWLDWFSAAGVARPGIPKGAHFEHFAMCIQAAISGIGLALMPHFLVADDIAAARLTIAFPLSIRTPVAYYFIYPEAKRNLPAIRVFRDWLLETSARSERDCASILESQFSQTCAAVGNRPNLMEPAPREMNFGGHATKISAVEGFSSRK